MERKYQLELERKNKEKEEKEKLRKEKLERQARDLQRRMEESRRKKELQELRKKWRILLGGRNGTLMEMGLNTPYDVRAVN